MATVTATALTMMTMTMMATMTTTTDSNDNGDGDDDRGMKALRKVMVVLEMVAAMVEVLAWLAQHA